MADKSFADYVKDVMAALPTVSSNPMLSMTSEDARYREDPFYKSREIQARDKLALDEKEKEEELKRLEEENARLEAMSNASGYGSQNAPLSREQLAFLGAESPTDRAARLERDLFGLKPIGAFMGGGMFGLSEYMGSQVPTYSELVSRAEAYNKAPSWLQSLLPESYQKANERATEYSNIMNGVNPYTDITPTFTTDFSSNNNNTSNTNTGLTPTQRDYTAAIGNFSV